MLKNWRKNLGFPTHKADYGLHAKVIRKTSDQTFTQSNTTLQNVTEMLFAVAANELWLIKLFLRTNSGTTPDIKVGWSLPAGATMFGGQLAYGTTGSIAWTNRASAGGYPAGGTAADFLNPIEFDIVVIGSTAGNIQLQASQNTSDASDTKVLANSCIIATRLS